MRIEVTSGRPTAGGLEQVLVAATWEAAAGANAARRQARLLAASGITGVWLSQPSAQMLEQALEAAKRAGLVVVTDRPAAVPADHLLVVGGDSQAAWSAVDSVAAAYTAFFTGARVVCGAQEAVAGLAGYLQLADEAGAWRPQSPCGPWLRRGSDAEGGAYSPSGTDLVVELVDGPAPVALHWIEPETGVVLGLTQVDSGTAHEVRVPPGRATAVYLGPSRWQAAAEEVAGPS